MYDVRFDGATSGYPKGIGWILEQFESYNAYGEAVAGLSDEEKAAYEELEKHKFESLQHFLEYVGYHESWHAYWMGNPDPSFKDVPEDRREFFEELEARRKEIELRYPFGFEYKRP